ncbi:MAG TPA: BBE domain-containing protein [Streptosporangiaceae bacterium]|nr:BBE domain-containing protein [Streptosporangiaceae bacterium]
MVTTGAGFYDIADGRAVLEALRELAAEAADETTWVASVWDAEPGSPVPEHYLGKPVVSLVFVHIGDVEEGAALGRRLRRAAAGFEFMAATSWTDPGEDATRRASTRRYADQIAPYGRGVYVNNLGIEGEDRVRDAYGAQKFERLTRLKARFDPDNAFHLNQNIRPATTSAARPH